MAKFARKLKRNQTVKARKKFTKDFKSAMSKFKKQVKCSACGLVPHQGQSIDDWFINKSSENIDLLCVDCYRDREEQGGEDEVSSEF